MSWSLMSNVTQLTPVVSNNITESNVTEIAMLDPCVNFWCLLQTCCIVLITVFIIITNIADIIVISFCFDEFDIPEHFMISLACADLGVGILVTPFSVLPSVYGDWMYSDQWCSIAGTLVAIFCSVSIFSMVLVSVDRYIAIMYPLKYLMVMSKLRCRIMIGLTWSVSVIIFGTYKFVLDDYYFDKKSYICSINFPHQPVFTTFIVATVVAPSMTSLCIIYFRIFRTAQRHRAQITQAQDQGSSSHQGDSVVTSTSFKKTPQWKNAKIYVFIVGSFIIAWMPYTFLQLILCTTDYEVCRSVVFIIQWLSMANSFWNTIIYFLMHPKYKQGCSKLKRYLISGNRIGHSWS